MFNFTFGSHSLKNSMQICFFLLYPARVCRFCIRESVESIPNSEKLGRNLQDCRRSLRMSRQIYHSLSVRVSGKSFGLAILGKYVRVFGQMPTVGLDKIHLYAFLDDFNVRC